MVRFCTRAFEIFLLLFYSPKGFRTMNFCDDYHIFDNFDDLDSSTRFPMLESALPQVGNKPPIMRIVSPAKEMTNICVQKYVLALVSDNNSESDSEYQDYMFMQGWYYFLTSSLENF